MRSGEWLQAAEDVEELEKVLLEAKSLDVLRSEQEIVEPARPSAAPREGQDGGAP
ncbi:hypothetical protein D3C71_2111800 [compost metagenome]